MKNDSLLSDWIYAESRLTTSLDQDLIEKHGTAQLARALNSRKLIAVVGSGLSTSYGKPSWKQTLAIMAQSVVERLESELFRFSNIQFDLSNLEGREAAAPWLTWPGHSQALEAFYSFGLPANADNLQNDRLPVAFGLCENLHALTRLWIKSRTKDSFVPKVEERAAYDELREQLKWQLKDDRGRLEVLFRRLFARSDWLMRVERRDGRWCSKKTKPNPRSYYKSLVLVVRHLSYNSSTQAGIQSRGSDLFAAAFGMHFYRLGEEDSLWPRDALTRLSKQNGSSQTVQSLRKEIEALLKVPSTSGQGPDPRPLIDFLVETSKPPIVAEIIGELACEVMRKYKFLDSDLAEVENEQYKSVPVRMAGGDKNKIHTEVNRARQAISRLRDPIAIMVEELEIKRFLTTNYDSLFDQYFESKGYGEPPTVTEPGISSLDPELAVTPTGSRSVLMDQTGNRVEFSTYEPGAAAFLFDYGADTRDQRHRVLHIHGRARKRDSWLVLSERDYRERYARDDTPSARSDDAMRLIFTANPLMFVGLGMTEPDILRPLRTFTQDVARMIDRPAVAVMQNDSEIKTENEKSDNNVVDISRYGVYTLRYRALLGEQQSPRLEQNISDIKSEENVDKFLAHQSLPSLPLTLAFYRRARKKIFPSEDWTRWKTEEVARIDHFFPDGDTEGSYIAALTDLAQKNQAPKFSGPEVRNVVTILGLLQVMHTTNSSIRARESDAVRYLLDGTKSMILTLYHCSYLLQLRDKWRSWKDGWAAAPAIREAAGGQPMQVVTAKVELNSDKQTLAIASHIQTSRHRVLLHNDQVQGQSKSKLWYFTTSDEGARLQELKPHNAPSSDRFLLGAPTPALPLMKASLAMKAGIGSRSAQVIIPNKTKFGVSNRRIFFQLGGRGNGRGQMFSAMQAPERLVQMCEWLGIIEAETGSSPQNSDPLKRLSGIHRAFLNLGVSHEVISVFDRLASFLKEVAELEIERSNKPADWVRDLERLKEAQGNRMLSLRTALSVLNKLGSDKQKNLKRAIVVIDHFSVLFTDKGRPKNAQVRRIYDILVDPQYRCAPVDFVFLVSESHVPVNLRCSLGQQNSSAVTETLEVSMGQSGARSPLGIANLDPIWLRPNNLPLDCVEDGIRRLRQARVMEGRDELDPVRCEVTGDPFWCSSRAKNRSVRNGLEKLNPTSCYIMLVDAPRPGALATRFFPDTAAVLTCLPGSDQAAATPEILGFFEKKPDVTGGDANSFPPPTIWIEGEESREKNVIRDLFSRILTQGTVDEIARAFADSQNNDPVEASAIAFAATRVHKLKDGQWVPKFAAEASHKAGMAEVNSELLNKINGFKLSDNIPNIFDDLRIACGGNRFSLTLLLAAIDDMIERRKRGTPKNTVNLRPIAEFIERVRRATANRAPEARSDVVFDKVIELYRADQLSSLGFQLPTFPFAVPDFEIGFCLGATFKKQDSQQEKEEQEKWWELLQHGELSPHKEIFELQEQILLALSLIGQPVEASVLPAIAGIAKALESTRSIFVAKYSEIGSKSQEFDQFLLHVTLDLLVHRCLVFRIVPKGDENYTQEAGRRRHRFVVHRVVRRSIARRFDMPLVDYADVDQVTISLYATQPNDLPRPKAEAHRRIRQLVDQLSSYEREIIERTHPYQDAFFDADVADFNNKRKTVKLRSRLSESFEANPAMDGRTTDDETIEARHIMRARLRAAYGVIRSVYSVGVVSRFSTYEDDGLPTPEHGYFESHRLRVRWLLRLAVHLDGSDGRMRDEDKNVKKVPTRTFHAEEIVWLYNECGVLSLAQGRLLDAAHLLQSAERFARKHLERVEWGALHARIGLNAAVADIERGLLRRAENRLRQIIADQTETDPIVMIASGYLGLIAVTKGDTRTAFKLLENAADGLNSIGRSRAAAIMLLQHADALRLFCSESALALEEASERARRACDLAAQGGHEDIRQLGQLADVWIEITRTEGRATKDQKEAIDRRLDGIENYAAVMAMPRLQCRIALARATFLLSEGENTMAAEVAQKALQLATRHDMELRKVSALSLLGTAMLRQALRGPILQRRAINEARMLLHRARELAYGLEFNAEVSRIERVLSECS